ncbi:MAG TPA: arylesterase [Blastocatellia bacterium]|nr:arylesterase [Blastocatellia bacterium]
MRFWPSCLLFLTLLALAACKGGPSKASSPAMPANGVAKVVAFGDSLTAGYGLSPEESYPELLQKRLTADGLNYEVVNAGISGDTSAGGVRRINWTLEGGDVKVIIVELGANDILRGLDIAEMKENLSTIIEHAKKRGAQVLLAGMKAPTNSGIDYCRWTDEAFIDLAKEHNVALIPFLLDRVAGIPSLNQADGIHPNPAGARIVADTVYRYLKPMLEKTDKVASK